MNSALKAIFFFFFLNKPMMLEQRLCGLLQVCSGFWEAEVAKVYQVQGKFLIHLGRCDTFIHSIS